MVLLNGIKWYKLREVPEGSVVKFYNDDSGDTFTVGPERSNFPGDYYILKTGLTPTVFIRSAFIKSNWTWTSGSRECQIIEEAK